MNRWYHSGLEGYCKAAARMMSLPENNSGWGNFGRDLFADGRFDNAAQASKTWTLSRFRGQGRGSRPKLFEESWLGQQGRQYELEAIHTCVHGMCGKSSESALYDLYIAQQGTFAAEFHETVLPAICEGLSAERFHPSDIARFAQGIDKMLGQLDPALPQTFRNFAIPLVAAIIYGPDHAAARAGTDSATLKRSATRADADLPALDVDEDGIVVTQIFSPDAGIVGHSCSYDSDNVVLLGRGADAEAYFAMCDAELAGELCSKEPLLFPVAHTHKETSKAHGAIARIGGVWYYHDFSSNGSYVKSPRHPSAVHRGAVALAPGDRIFLGLEEPPAPDDDSAYRLATEILIAFKAEESGLVSAAS